MRTDYQHRSEAWVNEHYVNSKARGGVGWAHIPDKMLLACDRMEALIRRYPPPGGRMLEIGCGAGDISVMLAPRGLFTRIHGLDISETAIAWAREKAKQAGLAVQFDAADMVELRGVRDGSFDAVIAFACLHWIIGDDRRGCLGNIRRVLAPGGRFYLWTSCRDAAVTEPIASEGCDFDPETEILMRNNLPYFHLRTPEGVQAEIREAGLSLLHWDVDEKEPDDSPYFLGAVIGIAERPAP